MNKDSYILLKIINIERLRNSIILIPTLLRFRANLNNKYQD